jgi:hypothetical protein
VSSSSGLCQPVVPADNRVDHAEQIMTSHDDVLSFQFLSSDVLAPARGILMGLLLASIFWLLLAISLFLWA